MFIAHTTPALSPRITNLLIINDSRILKRNLDPLRLAGSGAEPTQIPDPEPDLDPLRSLARNRIPPNLVDLGGSG